MTIRAQPRITVLLAEDDADFRALVAAELTTRGFDVTCVRDGRELADELASFVVSSRRPRPDVIVSDIRMPGPSGLALLRAVNEADLHIPVILMTAFGDRRVHEIAAEHDAAAVLDKPFAFSDLETVLRAVAGIPTGATVSPTPSPVPTPAWAQQA